MSSSAANRRRTGDERDLSDHELELMKESFVYNVEKTVPARSAEIMMRREIDNLKYKNKKLSYQLEYRGYVAQKFELMLSKMKACRGKELAANRQQLDVFCNQLATQTGLAVNANKELVVAKKSIEKLNKEVERLKSKEVAEDSRVSEVTRKYEHLLNEAEKNSADKDLEIAKLEKTVKELEKANQTQKLRLFGAVDTMVELNDLYGDSFCQVANNGLQMTKQFAAKVYNNLGDCPTAGSDQSGEEVPEDCVT